jgi:hypothetical protein
MKITKRDFIMGTGFLGVASLAGAIPASSSEKAGAQSSSIFSVRDFDAKGDSRTADSNAVQKALDAAGAVSGTVYFPAGRYHCHDVKVHPHTTVMAEPQWTYRGDAGAMLLLDSDEADCLLNITGAFGVHLRGLFLKGRRNAPKASDPWRFPQQHGEIQPPGGLYCHRRLQDCRVLRPWCASAAHLAIYNSAQ